MKMRFKPVLLILGLFVFAGLMITSCGDDDDNGTTPANRAVLKDSINVAIALLANTEEGGNDGQFPSAARTALQTAITAAQAADANETLTQAQVNAAVVSLSATLATYRAAAIAPIAEADLVGHWSFDEGSGTTAHDNANGFNGTFKTGAVAWGAGIPVWAADRKGSANKAVHFDKGANIEVPYNTNLNPKKISIALWINADEVNANNRFLGLQSWIAYKFQLQEANRPFMTVHTQDDNYYDRDAELNLPIGEWHHIVATFGDGNMIFYVDGEVVKTWDNTPGEAMSIAGTPYSLVFGQDFPTDQYAPTPDNFETDQKIPLDWGGYFRGFLDEIRIYKAVLTESQVQQLYDREKP